MSCFFPLLARSLPLPCTCPRKLAHSPSLKHLNSSHFKAEPQLLRSPLHRGLDNISITRGTFNELHLPRAPAFASRAAHKGCPIFSVGGERGAWHGALPWQRGDSRGVPPSSQRVRSAPGTPVSHGQYVADQQRRERVRQGAASRRSIPRFCLLPAAGRGEGELQAPPSPPAAPSPPALPRQEESKTHPTLCVEKRPEKVTFSLCLLLHHHPAVGCFEST